MTRFNLTSSALRLCFGSFALLAALPACSDRNPPNNTNGDDSSSSGSGSSTTMEETPTGDPTAPTTTGDTDTSGSGTEGMTEAMTTTTTNTSVTTMPAGCMDEIEDQANDAECSDASGCGCASGKCFLVPILGGWCGECLGDVDCSGGGCTVPNPIDGVGSTCNQGEPGAGCESNEVCTDPKNLACGTLLEVQGIIKVATCGECATNMECLDAALPNCSPTYDVMNFTGKYVCVGDATVPNSSGCNLADDGKGNPVGNSACESGFCGEANVMGLLKVGVCGECNSNADCPANKPTCTDPIVDLDAAALVGSICQ